MTVEAERVSLPQSSMNMMGFAVCCLCCSPAFSGRQIAAFERLNTSGKDSSAAE